MSRRKGWCKRAGISVLAFMVWTGAVRMNDPKTVRAAEDCEGDACVVTMDEGAPDGRPPGEPLRTDPQPSSSTGETTEPSKPKEETKEPSGTGEQGKDGTESGVQGGEKAKPADEAKSGEGSAPGEETKSGEAGMEDGDPEKEQNEAPKPAAHETEQTKPSGQTEEAVIHGEERTEENASGEEMPAALSGQEKRASLSGTGLRADGRILTLGRVAESEYRLFQKEAEKRIRSADDPVIIGTNTWISFHRSVMQAIEETGKAVTVQYRHGGTSCEVTIPAGCPATALLTENGYCGFLYLQAQFGAAAGAGGN